METNKTIFALHPPKIFFRNQDAFVGPQDHIFFFFLKEKTHLCGVCLIS